MFVPSLGTIISSLQLARALPASSVVSSVSVFPQADLVNDLGNKGYLVFGLILFIWELLPTTLLVGFFRVHRPPQDLVGPPPNASWSSIEVLDPGNSGLGSWDSYGIRKQYP